MMEHARKQGELPRALLCDIRIASSDARFMLPEVTHGVIPDTGEWQLCMKSPGTAW